MSDNKKNPVEEVLNIFQKGFNQQVILYGPPGTSKTYSSTLIAANLLAGKPITDYADAKKTLENDYKDRFQLIQFHPSYNYDDFVRGIQMKTEENGQPKYETVNKIFGEFAEKAARNQDDNYVMIIDEINRAPLASVLGELIYGLEYRGRSVSTPYQVVDSNGVGSNSIVVPENLYIIGTMNTADRSIGTIDYAVRRRFAFVPLHSDFMKAVETWENSKIEGCLKKKCKDALRNLWESIDGEVKKDKENQEEKGIQFVSDVDPEDVRIGHTYFIYDPEKAGEEEASINAYMNYRVEYQIKPILREYLNDGLINPSEKEAINALKWNMP